MAMHGAGSLDLLTSNNDNFVRCFSAETFQEKRYCILSYLALTKAVTDPAAQHITRRAYIWLRLITWLCVLRAVTLSL